MTKNPQGTLNDQRNPKTGRFLAGNIGGGRPRGSRSKLGEQFVSDLYRQWQIDGPAALETMARNDPSGFVRVVANILPKEIDASMSFDVELFSEAATFAEALKIARAHIGAEDTIDLEAIEHGSVPTDDE